MTPKWMHNLDRFEQGNRAKKRKQPRHSLTTGSRQVSDIRDRVGHQRRFGPALGRGPKNDTPAGATVHYPAGRGAIQGGAE